MKSFLQILILMVTGFVTKTLAAWAEFGTQMNIPGLSAAADLTTYQYRIMRMAGTNTTNCVSEVLKAGANTRPIGVLQNKPKSGEAATVAFLGVSKVVGGGTVTAGALIASTVSGMAVNAVSGDCAIGIALETATTAGEVLTALLTFPVQFGVVA